MGKTGLAGANQIQPLDQNGNPSPNGKIVLMSIGFSNNTQEWSGKSKHFEGLAQGFMPRVENYINRNPHLVVVDGAASGRAANSITPGGIYYDSYWNQMVPTRLSQAGVTGKQVQAIWLKVTNACPGQTICSNKNLTPARGDFPGIAEELKDDLAQIVSELERRYPNLKQIFVSPRTYGGYALGPLGPEPYAFEYGFSFKWLIEDRINSGKTLPWIDWGPYLWANGTKPNSAGLSWKCEDFSEADRTHPSKSGVEKVGKLLLDFLSTDKTTCSWFNKNTSSCPK